MTTVLLLLAGLTMLLLGGASLVRGASGIAEAPGISPLVVGLTVVAFGTSLPEIVTSIIAAMRKEADLCVGNVIGSNIFNILLVLPISALVYPLSIPEHGTTDIIATLLFAAVLIPVLIMRGQIMNRTVGRVFLGAYLLYMYLRITG